MIRPVEDDKPVRLSGGTPVYHPYPVRELSLQEVREIVLRAKESHMAVRAKFYVSEVKQSKYHSMGQEGELLTVIKLLPVNSTSEENKQFFRWSPAGSIDLGTVNPAVVEQMHIGDEFYVDFTPAGDQK